jgi:hypothetical protein
VRADALNIANGRGSSPEAGDDEFDVAGIATGDGASATGSPALVIGAAGRGAARDVSFASIVQLPRNTAGNVACAPAFQAGSKAHASTHPSKRARQYAITVNLDDPAWSAIDAAQSSHLSHLDHVQPGDTGLEVLP